MSHTPRQMHGSDSSITGPLAYDLSSTAQSVISTGGVEFRPLIHTGERELMRLQKIYQSLCREFERLFWDLLEKNKSPSESHGDFKNSL